MPKVIFHYWFHYVFKLFNSYPEALACEWFFSVFAINSNCICIIDLILAISSVAMKILLYPSNVFIYNKISWYDV